jgi:hypothetical protein
MAAVIAGDTVSLSWHLLTLGVGLGVFALGFIARGFMRTLLKVLPLLVYTLLVVLVLVWAVFSAQVHPSFFLLENENSLAAVLVTLGTVALVLWSATGFIVFYLFGVLAVLFTGSRLALGVYVFALILGSLRWTMRRKLVTLILIMLGAALLWLIVQPRERVNLLTFSNDLMQPVWVTYGKTELELSDAPGPFENARAVRLRSTSDRSESLKGTIFMQRLTEASRPGVSYLASVYVKSEHPQQMMLTNGFNSVVCDVALVWQRCVTPVAIGDGKAHVQFQLRTLEPGGNLDIYLWGPQLEIGTEPSEVVLTEDTLWERLLYRVPLRTDALEPENILDVSYRLEIARSAWQVFLEHPIAGVGLGGLRSIFAQQDFAATEPPVHAHNLVLQLLAETGVLGLLAWLLTFWGTLLTVGRTHWRQLAPLVIAVLLLNTVDFTYFTNFAYYAYWLTVGLVTSPNTKNPTG